MDTLGTILSGVGSLISVVCLIMVLLKMFQKGETGLAIVFLLLSCCGIGFLITFIYGWVKSGQWNIKNVMLAWTVGWILGIVGGVMNPGQFNRLQQMQQQGR